MTSSDEECLRVFGDRNSVKFVLGIMGRSLGLSDTPIVMTVTRQQATEGLRELTKLDLDSVREHSAMSIQLFSRRLEDLTPEAKLALCHDVVIWWLCELREGRGACYVLGTQQEHAS